MLKENKSSNNCTEWSSDEGFINYEIFNEMLKNNKKYDTTHITRLTVGYLKEFISVCNIPDNTLIGIKLTNGDFGMITKAIMRPKDGLILEVKNDW